MLAAFLTVPNLNCGSLRRIICSGEALNAELQKMCFDRLDAELHNLYGPTEAAIDVTAAPCQRENVSGAVLIGSPIANIQIYILDRSGQPVPIGVPGELYLAGVGLARGYHNRSDLTAERFVPNPFSAEPGTRLYRTGDLVRWLSTGTVEFLGRIDHQVKVRGVRIELGEIEAALRQHPGVSAAVVVLRTEVPDSPVLVAYIVTTDRTLSPAILRTALQERLPMTLIPSAFVILDSLPLMPNGKIDRRALPAPAPIRPDPATPLALPTTPIEEQLVRIWADVLSIEQVGVEDNFFMLGGHSLLAVKLLSRVREAFGVELPLGELFASPTIRSLASVIDQRSSSNDQIQQNQIQASPRGTKTIEQLLAELKGRSES